MVFILNNNKIYKNEIINNQINIMLFKNIYK